MTKRLMAVRARLSDDTFSKRDTKIIPDLMSIHLARFKAFDVNVAKVLGVSYFLPVEDQEVAAPATTFLLLVAQENSRKDFRAKLVQACLILISDRQVGD